MQVQLAEFQLKQLRKLSDICTALKRKLMVEIIIQKDLAQEDVSIGKEEELAEAIDEVYKKDIYPYWWGINALEIEEKWVKIKETINKNDPDVGVIFKYNYSQIEKLPSWLSIVHSNRKNFGLSFGENIFWEQWEKYIKTNAKDNQVKSEISERFQKLLNLWSDL